MRILGAIAISLSGAVASFIGVLAALDGVAPVPRDSPDTGRVATFAVPALSNAIATAKPTRNRKAAAIASGGGAWVPPIVRRRPVDPAPPAAVAEAQPAPPAIVAPKPVPAPRVAQAKRPPSQPFEPISRSALGGPRPSAETR